MRKSSALKIVALMLIALFVVSFTAPAAFAKGPESKGNNGVLHGKAQWKIGFSDVDETLEWARMAIDKLNAKGIFKGYPGGIFKPRENVTHLEAIVIALRIMGWEDDVDSVKNLSGSIKNLNVSWEKGYYYIALAVEKGLVKPEELKGFNPNTPAKRYEVARYIVRALGKEDEAQSHMEDKLPFKDAKSIPGNAVGYVYVITDLDLMKGYPGNVFLPQKPITRAEMAVLAEKLEGIVNPEEKNPLIGTVQEVDSTNLEITIKNSYGEKTYNTIEDVPVYIYGEYGDLEDINEGDSVELVLNADKDVVFIQVLDRTDVPITVSAKGFVTDVDEDESTVSIFTYVKDDREVFVGTLEENDVEGSHYELSTEQGTFVLTGNTDGLEDYVGKRIVVEGTLKTDVSIFMRGSLIDVKDFFPVRAGNTVTFKVDDDARITIDGKKAELSDIEIGDLAEIKAQDNLAQDIEVQSFRERMRDRETQEIEDGKLEGRVISLELKSQWEITVENDEGRYTLVLDKDVELKNIETLSDIKAGMKVELRIINGKVTGIKAED